MPKQVDYHLCSSPAEPRSELNHLAWRGGDECRFHWVRLFKSVWSGCLVWGIPFIMASSQTTPYFLDQSPMGHIQLSAYTMERIKSCSMTCLSSRFLSFQNAWFDLLGYLKHQVGLQTSVMLNASGWGSCVRFQGRECSVELSVYSDTFALLNNLLIAVIVL